ncbi:hypothetical protein BDW69DRAFT_83270 [Aspergillus filifer]
MYPDIEQLKITLTGSMRLGNAIIRPCNESANLLHHVGFYFPSLLSVLSLFLFVFLLISLKMRQHLRLCA